MKVIITTGMLRRKPYGPCVYAQFILPKSKKLNVPKKRSKTWSFPTVAPEFTSKEIRPMIEAEAKRWEAKQMARFAREKELSEAVAKGNADREAKEVITPPTPASAPAAS